ncbi:hypothetical protein OKA05_08085 [Luteolibacter arcticus]|uniref:Lipoprotein n=1 Tax=Luteolibacter arcticus TaxID=1581411 RepID=A0ABT3GFW0_9BACT|nr:hypothetical protein [Luteolibacter arcticus]MCW1922510.1 hypothetical protein [Luteolibacter arcticus]
MKTLILASAAAVSLFVTSCETHNHYPMTVVEPAPKPAAKPKPVSRPKPAPKPVESAESFRAVEKPGSYSN